MVYGFNDAMGGSQLADKVEGFGDFLVGVSPGQGILTDLRWSEFYDRTGELTLNRFTSFPQVDSKQGNVIVGLGQ